MLTGFVLFVDAFVDVIVFVVVFEGFAFVDGALGVFVYRYTVPVSCNSY